MDEALLRRNVRLYSWFKVFVKRVFLPLIAIYLVSVGHVTLGNIGVITAVTGFVILLAQMPTGYIADRYTRRSALMTGSLFLVSSVSVLVVWPSFVGGLAASMLSGIGFAFLQGSSQAMIHDSLEACGRKSQYVKVMGRAQAYGLLGNIVLVSLVPMTYAINKRLPFVLGIVAFLILFVISWSFVEPPREKNEGSNHAVRDMMLAIRSFISKRTILLFVAIGVVFGLYVAPADYTTLVLKDLGMLPQYLGWAYAASSLLGAIGGYGIGYFERLSFRTFMFLDIAICCGFFVAVGLSRNLLVAVSAFVVALGFWRVRSILYQHYLLEIFKGTRNK